MNGLCYHCGTPLTNGHWMAPIIGVVFDNFDDVATMRTGEHFLYCPACMIGWKVIRSGGGSYPSFMQDGHQWRGLATPRTQKEQPVKSAADQGWVPVVEDTTAAAKPSYIDTASEPVFSLRLTCSCGEEHYFDRFSGSLYVCPICGRVYRAKVRFWVEEYLGRERS